MAQEASFTLSTGPGDSAKKARVLQDQTYLGDPTTAIPAPTTVYDEVATLVNADGSYVPLSQGIWQLRQMLLAILVESRVQTRLMIEEFRGGTKTNDLDLLRQDEQTELDNIYGNFV